MCSQLMKENEFLRDENQKMMEKLNELLKSYPDLLTGTCH